jgi:hypothetical protein
VSSGSNDEPTTLEVYRGADGRFTLYEDDGVSLDYLCLFGFSVIREMELWSNPHGNAA